MKIEVGQRVWFTENIFHRNDGLCKGKVTKVGHKYIYVKGPYREFKFDKATLRQDSLEGTYGQLYLKEEDYQNLMELRTNIELIRDRFPSHNGKVTLEQTREILEILRRLS